MIIGIILTVLLTVFITLVVRKLTSMSEDFDDYRKIAFETPLKSKSLWVPQWNRWVTVRELKGKERSKLLQDCTDVEGKKAKVNLVKLYPMMTILSIRYPDPSFPPPVGDPNYHKFPGANGLPAHPKAGQQIFTDMRDIMALNEGGGSVLELLNKPASELSGLREEDIEEKKDTSEENTVESDGYTIE
jgi:hypothetical protein